MARITKPNRVRKGGMMMLMLMKRKGFTLVEIMIVVAIICLLGAIAIPSFIKARQKAEKDACIANLRQIEGAVQVWAIDNNKPAGAQPTQKDLVPNYMRTWPTCRGVPYVLPAVNQTPACPNNDPTHTINPQQQGEG
jgi:prepilin-type N-terminal cleavage/methylation domain-containing protein